MSKYSTLSLLLLNFIYIILDINILKGKTKQSYMKLKINKFFEEISKLSKKEQEIIGRLSFFQLKVIAYLEKNKKASVPELIQMDNTASRAQKYRYIQALQKFKFCKLNNKQQLVLK